MDGDEEGIREIRRKAEADTEMTGWNKLRIIQECELALLDLLLVRQKASGER